MNKNKVLFASLIFIILLLVSPLSSAHSQSEERDIEIFGIELELVLALANAFIALFLFILAFTAFQRDRRTRILYVSMAFLALSIKNFIVSSELFIPSIPWLDPITIILEFIAILIFFYGTLRK